MSRVSNKKELDILEQSGLWKAAAFLSRLTEKLRRKHLPLEIGHIKQAHRIIFETAKQSEIAGKYRTDNGPELKRIDGSILKITDWRYIPNEMAQLNYDLCDQTANLSSPKTKGAYRRIILIAAKLSHRLASIHPFHNGNGRASRLLLNAILQRAGLPEVAIKDNKNENSKEKYLRDMRCADDGDFEPLENIIKMSLRNVFKKRNEEIRKIQGGIAKSNKRHFGKKR